MNPQRHLWEDNPSEQGGPARFKSKWNNQLSELLGGLYIGLLNSLKSHFKNNPEKIYEYWPCEGVSLGEFTNSMMYQFLENLFSDENELLWDKYLKKWISFKNTILPDPRVESDAIYVALNAINIKTIFLPEKNQQFIVSQHALVSEETGLQQLSENVLIHILKRNTDRHYALGQITNKVADEILSYLLTQITNQSPSQTVQSFFGKLDGLKIVPLLNNQVGTFKVAGKASLQHEIYLVAKKEKHEKLLGPECNQFINSKSKSYAKLKMKNIQNHCNCKSFNGKILTLFFDYILPKSWKGVNAVYVSGELLNQHVINVSTSHIQHKKKKKNIPQGLVYARDSSIKLDLLSKQLQGSIKSYIHFLFFYFFIFYLQI